ncbi:RICIN domain-containing protein [Streptomyces sp. NPDC055992]|uniref:GH12 family glycosyl hydrolase domain-containing protein n=1 Tax=Streptomyces sp. NPDC055992 TaxID=3345673 RepID=UPI0035DCDCA1
MSRHALHRPRARALRLWASVLALLVSSLGAALTTAPQAAAATTLCDAYASTSIQQGRYIVQNNRWGASTRQCIEARDRGFAITASDHNNPTNSVPAGYPSVYAGCHYANCTSGSGLPLRVSDFGNVRSSVAMTRPASGEWNASYDLWFDPTPRSDGQNTGAELMIWLDHRGRPQPIGSRVATTTIEGASWDVWVGNIGWNVISYVRTSGTGALDFAVRSFTDDAVARGQIQRSWYMTSVQAGFEPWVGGAGLAVDDFSFTTNGGSGGGGARALVGRQSGRCLDVSGGSSANGTPVILWDCWGGAPQQWTVGSDGTVRAFGKCLEVTGGAAARDNGAGIGLWDCWGGANQRWTLNSDGTLRNPNSGRCLEAAGQGTANGTRIQLWDCWGGENMKWDLR